MSQTTKLLEEARQKVSFDVKEMTKIVYVTDEFLKQIQTQQAKLDAYGDFNIGPDFYNKSRKELMMTGPKKLLRVHETIPVGVFDDWAGILSYSQNTVFGMVCFGMVVPALRILGTDEQIERWVPDILNLKIIAPYAQTEIGRGSDVQGLQTTATLDKNTDEFIIDTPTIEAIKFWPGEMGLLGNWALVYAQLVIDGKSHGVYPFMVPIRDMETHKPLPGVVVGDIGPKLGYQTKDNGFLKFNKVRIPRTYMLMRYTRVEKDGTITKHGNEKVSYSAMMLIRKLIIYIFSRVPCQALTIAIRFSIQRQQFTNDKGVENQVLDYQAQQDKLLPLLARQYAILFGGFYCKHLVEENFERVKKKDFSIMQLTHALLSGAKANYSYFCIEAIEWCRLSCGGHGFAHYSGLPGMFFELVPNVTLEGENQVMYLQLARYMLKVLQYTQKNPDRIPEIFAFFKDIQTLLSTRQSASTEQELSNLDIINVFLQQNSAAALMHVVMLIQKYSAEGLKYKEIWDYKVNDHLVHAAEAFTEYFTYNVFKQHIAREVKDQKCKNVLIALCQLHGVTTVLTHCQHLINNDLISVEQLRTLRKIKESLLTVIKPEAIGLVDAFGLSDQHLKTTIGCHDGQMYERTFHWAKDVNSINKAKVLKGVRNLKEIKARI